MMLKYKTFLGIKIKKDGWKDLGKINGVYNEKTKMTSYCCHAYCNTKLHIGIFTKDNTDNALFQFCPRCKIIIENKKE